MDEGIEIYLFIWKSEMQREEKERISNCWFIPLASTMTSREPIWS